VQFRQSCAEVVGLEVEHQPLRVLHAEHAVWDRRARFQGETRVIARGPDARGEDLGFGRA
jgi:hypothetical protein